MIQFIHSFNTCDIQTCMKKNDSIMSNETADAAKGPGLPTPSTHNDAKGSSPRGEKSLKLKIKPQGESGRRGVHPWHFFRISFKSACRASTLCSVLWPVVPAALAVRCKSR